MRRIFSILFLLISILSHSQERRSYQATRVNKVPKIDGVINDSCWNNIPIASDFIQRELKPGMPSAQKSEVKLIYDDEAIYVSAVLFDVCHDSILHEMSTRDIEPNADLFGVMFDTYNDDINAFGFFVTAAGAQIDARYSSNGQDFDWNAVWLSEVKVNENDWTVELKIPFSAVRFSAKNEQVWGMTFLRKIRHLREFSFWSPIDPKIGTFIGQLGDLTGLKDVKPPLRLSITPYVAGIVTHYPYNQKGVNNLTYNASGGMDIKIGLSDAFTLDMTLVPDFSQVQSDNQVLNLSPFEVQFQERRPFFTEGTELFNKGGLFYSRRIGGLPLLYYGLNGQLNVNERVLKNPSQENLLNATKLSGRTKSKLGIGILNGFSGETYAIVKDTVTGTERRILTSPLVNYNITVLEQALKNNSSISLINTNVTRDGHFYDANVTRVGFALNNKKNRYFVSGSGAMSNIFISNKATANSGYHYDLSIGKSSGNFTWNLNTFANTDTYNPNDLGIQVRNNNIDYNLNLSYNIYKPFLKFNNFNSMINFYYSRMYNPDAFANFGIYGKAITNLRKQFMTFGINYGLEPIITYDYFEPRVFGKFYTYPRNYKVGGFVSSDYRKKVAIDFSTGYRWFYENKRATHDFRVSPRWRITNKLSTILEFIREDRQDDIGFVNRNTSTDSITFGRRNLETITNVWSVSYKFTNKMSLSLRLRHYWSKARYNQFYNLNDDGSLDNTSYNNLHDVNFNATNIDVVYFWQFAPGSELNLVWKDAILERSNLLVNDYTTNFAKSFDQPQTNTISLKVLYYLDYVTVRKALRKKSKEV